MKGQRRNVNAQDAISGVRYWGLVLGVGLAAFLLYLPSLGSEFVYDAVAQIEIGDYIHDPAHFSEVLTLRVLGRDVLDFNRPVQLFSLMVDAQLWGKDPWGYHLSSNLLHAITAGLLVAVLLELASSVPAPSSAKLVAAGLGGLLFAFHPVQVETVAEVACREDILATLFLLGGILCAAAFSRRSGRNAWGWGAGCVGCLLLACGAKETGVIGPALILLYWRLFQGRQAWRRWVILLGLSLLAVASFFLARFVLPSGDSELFRYSPTYLGGSLDMALWIQPRLWVKMLSLLFWPLALSADYQPAEVLAIPAGPGLLGLALFIFGQVFLALRSRLAAMGLGIFWLGLAPVSNLIPLFRPLADRFLYLPLAGLTLMFVGGLLFVSPRRPLFLGGAILFGVLLLPLLSLTLQRQAVFSDSLSLWTETLKTSATSSTAANNLGFARVDAGDYRAALEAYERALQLTEGRSANALTGAAIALQHLGRREEAARLYQAAIEVDPIYAEPERLVELMSVTAEQAEVLREIQPRLPRK